MNSLHFAPWATASRIERLGRAGGEQYSIVFIDELLRIDKFHRAAPLLHNLRAVAPRKIFLSADVGAGDERHTFGFYQINPEMNYTLFQLHVRNTVHEQPADAVGPLVHSDLVPNFVEL